MFLFSETRLETHFSVPIRVKQQHILAFLSGTWVKLDLNLPGYHPQVLPYSSVVGKTGRKKARYLYSFWCMGQIGPEPTTHKFYFIAVLLEKLG